MAIMIPLQNPTDLIFNEAKAAATEDQLKAAIDWYEAREKGCSKMSNRTTDEGLHVHYNSQAIIARRRRYDLENELNKRFPHVRPLENPEIAQLYARTIKKYEVAGNMERAEMMGYIKRMYEARVTAYEMSNTPPEEIAQDVYIAASRLFFIATKEPF